MITAIEQQQQLMEDGDVDFAELIGKLAKKVGLELAEAKLHCQEDDEDEALFTPLPTGRTGEIIVVGDYRAATLEMQEGQKFMYFLLDVIGDSATGIWWMIS